jgi:hypothetical protein
MEELMVGERRKISGVEDERRGEDDGGLEKKGVRKCYLKFIKQLKDETRAESTRCLYNLC